MALQSFTTWNPQPTNGKTGNTVLRLHQFVNVAIAQAKKDGKTMVVLEDGIIKPVTDPIHFAKGRETWHAWYESIVLLGQTYALAGAAADLNIAGGGKAEEDYLWKTIVPLAKKYGIAYYVEDFGTPNAHLHVDIGAYYNDGIRGDGKWHLADWIGKGPEIDNVVYPADLPVYKNAKTNTPSTVKVVQVKVGATPDGLFGAATETKVKAYQKKNKLTADGVVGKATWKVMNS